MFIYIYIYIYVYIYIHIYMYVLYINSFKVVITVIICYTMLSNCPGVHLPSTHLLMLPLSVG